LKQVFLPGRRGQYQPGASAKLQKMGPVYQRLNKTPWPKDFPNATLHTSMQALKHHPAYEAAKSCDIEAAGRVVVDLIVPDKIKQLFKKHPNAIVVAPMLKKRAGAMLCRKHWQRFFVMPDLKLMKALSKPIKPQGQRKMRL
jgi:hypothetical protein